MKQIAIVALAVSATLSSAQTPAGPGPALNAIKAFADDFCGPEPTNPEQIKGTTRQMELSASAKAGLSKLFKELVDVGLDLTGKISQAQYQGLLQADIPKLLADRRSCRLAIFNSLVTRVVERESRELKFTIRRNLAFLNMGTHKQLFIQDPNVEGASNGLGLRIWEIKLSGSPPISTLQLTLTAPRNERVKFEADESSVTQLSTASCKAISISVGKMVYSLSEKMKSQTAASDVPLRLTDTTKPVCYNSWQTCSVQVEIAARCAIDA